jgi:hypothetical protein
MLAKNSLSKVYRHLLNKKLQFKMLIQILKLNKEAPNTFTDLKMLPIFVLGCTANIGGLVVSMLASGTFGGLVVSMLASGTQKRGFAPGRSRRIFRAKKPSACLPSDGK